MIEIRSDLIELEASSNACWNAVDESTATIFNPPANGTLAGIRLLHNSGAVSCSTTNGYSFWGCTTSHTQDFWSALVRVNSLNEAKYTLYPTDDTLGVESVGTFSNCNCSIQYVIMSDDIYTANSTSYLFLSDTIEYKVNTNELYSMHYCEADCEHTITDNGGTTCATVYFLYSGLCVSIV